MIKDEKGQARIIEAMLACLILIVGLSSAAYIYRVNISLEENIMEEYGANICDVLCDPVILQKIIQGGELTEAQLKTLMGTLLPTCSLYDVSFQSLTSNNTLMNTTNMASSYLPYSVFSTLEMAIVPLPISQVEYVPIDVMLVMDVSGSMGDDYNETHTKLDLAKAAAKTFIDQLNGTRDRAGLVSFSTDADLVCSLTNNSETIKSQIDTLTAGGYTNIGGGISKANEEFVNNGRSDAIWVMILLSDGEANRPENETYARQYAFEQAECAKILEGKGVRIYTVGLGSPDEELLRQIATDENKYYYAPTSDQLTSIYLAISKDILLQVRYETIIINLNIEGSG